MRTAMDEIIDLNLGEKTCIAMASIIETHLIKHEVLPAGWEEQEPDHAHERKYLLRVFYSLQLLRESIADKLNIPYD